MADISQIKLPNNTIYDIKDNNALPLTGGSVTGPVSFGDAVTIDEATVGDLVVNGSGSFTNNVNLNKLNNVAAGNTVEYIVGTQAASTNLWTGVTKDSVLYDGKMIIYVLPYAGTSTAATLNLTLADGTTTGAKGVFRYGGTTGITTHYAALSRIFLIYDAANNRWNSSAWYYSDSNTVDRLRDSYFRPYAGEAVYRYKFVMQGADNRMYPITVTNQEDATQVAKVPTQVGLRPGRIWYYNTTATVAAGGLFAANTLDEAYQTTVGAYNFNTEITTYRMLYLRGTYNKATDLFTLYKDSSSPCTSYYTQVPTNTANITLSSYFTSGYYYLLVGGTYSTANYISLFVNNPLYYFDGTNLIPVSTKVAQDTNTTYSAGTGISLSGTTFSAKLGYTTSGNNRAVQADANGNLYVTQKDDNSGGTVTKVIAGTGLSIGTTAGGNFTTSGTINHTNSVTAQTTQAVYPIKIDAQGHISAYGSAVTIPDVSGKIDTAGTGLSKSGTTLNHSNSITAQTTQAIYPIKIDAQGHISAYGSAVTPLTSHQTIKQDGVTGATGNHYGACSTAAGTAAKTVSITAGTPTLEAGLRVTVKFANANTAGTPTLNVNSLGAKNIFHNGAQITTGANKALLAGTVEFVYDGTQWQLVGNYIDTNTADTNTTYTLSGALSSHKFTSTLTAGGSGSGTSTSDFTLAAGTGITITDDTSNRKMTIACSVTNTDTKVSTAAVTSATLYYPIVGEDTTSAATKFYDKTGITYMGVNGTTSSVGGAVLTLGNSTASGTANNKQGELVLYSSSAYKGSLKTDFLGANRTYTFPDNNGTIALSDEIPLITLNGSSSMDASFYAPTTAGTNGYVLKSNGSGAPTWTSATLTDTKVTTAALTSGTLYYPILATGTGTATRQIDSTLVGLTYKSTAGTTSAVGTAQLTLGNNKASGTANNERGQLILYGSTAYAHTIQGAPTAARTLTLPNKTGTIAITDDILELKDDNIEISESTWLSFSSGYLLMPADLSEALIQIDEGFSDMLQVATISKKGLMSSIDKLYLDGLSNAIGTTTSTITIKNGSSSGRTIYLETYTSDTADVSLISAITALGWDSEVLVS